MRLQEVYEEAEVAGVKIPIPARIQVKTTKCTCVRSGAIADLVLFFLCVCCFWLLKLAETYTVKFDEGSAPLDVAFSTGPAVVSAL